MATAEDASGTLRANGYDERFLELVGSYEGPGLKRPPRWVIRGTVVDAASGEPLEGVAVRAHEPVLLCDGKAIHFLHGPCYTNSAGSFELSLPRDVLHRQLGLALATTRAEAEARGLYFGTVDLDISREDYLSQSVPRATADIGNIKLTSSKGLVQWVVSASDATTGSHIINASMTVELLADPPYPDGPQVLVLPVVLILGSHSEHVRGRVEAPGYMPHEFDLVLEPGMQEQDFVLHGE